MVDRFRWVLWGTGAAVLALAASTFTLDAREVAVVTAFGAPVRTALAPGLYLKAPWPLHEVVRFDSRTRVLAVKATELLTRDKKNLVVEAFLLWRVADPQRFLESVGEAAAAEVQLSDLVSSQVAAALGQRDFSDVLAVRPEAAALLPGSVVDGITAAASARLGVRVLDVRIRHVGLPLQNEQSIYERMRAERLRTANAYRSEGEEQAAAIRARADREAAEILARADEEASTITSEAARAAAARYAEAWRQDPAFFRALSTLDNMEEVVQDGTILVVDPSSPAFRPLQEAPR